MLDDVITRHDAGSKRVSGGTWPKYKGSVALSAWLPEGEERVGGHRRKERPPLSVCVQVRKYLKKIFYSIELSWTIEITEVDE